MNKKSYKAMVKTSSEKAVEMNVSIYLKSGILEREESQEQRQKELEQVKNKVAKAIESAGIPGFNFVYIKIDRVSRPRL